MIFFFVAFDADWDKQLCCSVLNVFNGLNSNCVKYAVISCSHSMRHLFKAMQSKDPGDFKSIQ